MDQAKAGKISTLSEENTSTINLCFEKDITNRDSYKKVKSLHWLFLIKIRFVSNSY